jgi:hypothetical protein
MRRKTQRKLKKKKDINIDAKRAIRLNCHNKTCRSNKYKLVYGIIGGSVRSNRALFF